ncbi:SusC/RagA family TonB-linked outer membrane protein [Mucilaginibacter myungsuensis]|uniref:SusC/RagA family TonB-linked outer membrane protein n=1 Tax=Mucilaginibacter myungsuensis TaxID=649104 RepID=A0A929PYU6_9SPHI|nr:SusC/RagA family TonB-linked outer membrane protein [Mucilaginibacter myungsuensis]MBE9664641.1 SusC/RagA family TonB-linked outer membrane protein [Mucilaginibacter myungsuensis]MDN3601468.1 SusC/RagA family TonB-linked outer membrane protein [Mucilaginibacter myungsuensis]
MRIIATITFLGVLCSATYSFGNTTVFAGAFQQQGALANTSSAKDTAKVTIDTSIVRMSPVKKAIAKRLESKNSSVDPVKLSTFPAISLQQYLKGQAAGLFSQESTGEPGTVQNMFIHGTSQPLLSSREVFATQPLVVLDGVPLVSEHPFAEDIQQYKFNRIGPATNVYAAFDMANIQSVQVLSGLNATAIYGPKAANGAIVLITNDPGNKRRVTFDGYTSLAAPQSVTTINGRFENDFRKQFYNKYTSNGSFSNDDVYPVFLSDSLNNAFYGPANWSDRYYGSKLQYSVNASIDGGNERANFRFSLGNTRSAGVGDDTKLDRYSARFVINMKPLTWFTFSAMVNANQLLRDRNRNVRDRLAQVNYIPDLSNPLTPNITKYSEYLDQFDRGFDNNKSNLYNGYAKFAAEFGKFKFVSTFAVDYNEGYRDIFYPRTLLQTNNYASNYFGFNQRATIDNVATYDYDLNSDNSFNFALGQTMQYDFYQYTYAYAYKGSNDFIKLNLLNNDLTPTVFRQQLVYKFLDKTRNNQFSVYGKADYSYKTKINLSLLLRADASSTQQPTSRWFYSPVVSASWDLKKEFLQDEKGITEFNLRGSAGRMGRFENFDNYSQGPQYTAYIGFTGNLITPGYNGLAVLTRPYTAGSTGYDLKWAYTDQANLGFDLGFLNGRLNASVDAYYRHDKNMLLSVPSAAEYGYTGVIKNGMAIRNTGIDLGVSANILAADKNLFGWTSSLNANFNKNQLTALPGGLNQIVIGDKLLKVGQSVDSYWLLTNDGIYTTDAQVPADGTGRKMTYNGITLKSGDPRWRDLNGDNQITDADKTLKGNALPKVSGGWNNNFTYKNWNLGVDFYYNLGRQVMNQQMANRFDFINREGLNDITSVREVFYWEKRGDYSKYPLYNPASSVVPYQVNQDLFMENASFVKLRTLQLGYDLTAIMKKKSPNLQKFYVYGSVNNVFTLTKYSGPDPELVNYTGYDNGYGMQIPRVFMLGIKADF